VDSLKYTYNTNSNKILKVDDLSNETASFKDVIGNDYGYSLDGSLTSDANKGITLIEYNYLKLPRRIVQNGVTTLYQYDAIGKKLKETISTQVTDYSGNKIYKNNVLYQISHGEGRVVKDIYEYDIKDHLGSLRVSFKDSIGIAKIVQANHNGIFGEELSTLSYRNTPNLNNFKYSNHEILQGTGYIDCGARLYDNLVPRFTTIDPLSESSRRFSPFVYANSNPLRFIDPDGMKAQRVKGSDGRWHDVSDDDGVDIYNAPPENKESQQDDQSNVSRTLYNTSLQDWKDKNLNCSSSYACYPATWRRLERAYSDASGSVPEVFKTTWSKSYKNSNRTYPDLNTIFGILFGSDNQNPLWNTIPIEHRGKGVAGAMVYAGLGQYADVWNGELKRSSVIQLWDSQKTFEMVRDGINIQNVPNAIGHAIIFMWYLKDGNGNINGFKFIDQAGSGTASPGNVVYFGANLLDEKK
jgi:RHS repeat-associated protein